MRRESNSANPLLRILVTDDEEIFRKVLVKELGRMGFEAEGAGDANQAFEALRRCDYEVVLLDMRMPDMDGLTALKRIKEDHPLTEVIMLTAFGTIDSAIAAVKSGAYDYLTKPCELEELEATVLKAGEKRRLEQSNAALREELSRRDQWGEFVGSSDGLGRALTLIRKVAPSESTVLILGESGVGKELAARAIHTQSARTLNPFIVVDCASLQEDLLQTELFGHEKGAFTGAVGLKRGLFEVADTGTMFLDEIAEMTLGLQAKLLRVIETGTFRRVGGVKDIHVDVRIIAATNRDLGEACSDGTFREDLYYRLNVFTIMIPPLRERPDDIPVLARHFIAKGSPRRTSPPQLSPAALDRLGRYQWPGNVRELRNVIERALILAEGDRIEPQHLPGNLLGPPPFSSESGSGQPLTLEEAEKLYIARLLAENAGNRGKVAAILNVSERNLYRKIKRYGL